MDTTLYKSIVIHRLMHFLTNVTQLADGRTEVIEDRKICLWINNDDNKLVEQAIASFHKSVDKVTPIDPVEISDSITFLGSSESFIKKYNKTMNDTFLESKTYTGIHTLAFERNGVIIYVPSIFLYVDTVPHILVPKNGFTIGKQLNNTYTTQDVLYLPFTDDILIKIANYAFNNIDDVDTKMIDIVLGLKSEKLDYVEITPDLKDIIVRLGYNPNIPSLLEHFLFIPILKFDEEGVSEVLVKESGTYYSIPYGEYLNNNSRAVILSVPTTYNIRSTDSENLYSFSGKDYYVDDTEYTKSPSGGYRREYKVYAESSGVKSIHAGAIYELTRLHGVGENHLIDTSVIDDPVLSKIKKDLNEYKKNIKSIKSDVKLIRRLDVETKRMLQKIQVIGKKHINRVDEHVDDNRFITYLLMIHSIRKGVGLENSTENLYELLHGFEDRIEELLTRREQEIKTTLRHAVIRHLDFQIPVFQRFVNTLKEEITSIDGELKSQNKVLIINSKNESGE